MYLGRPSQRAPWLTGSRSGLTTQPAPGNQTLLCPRTVVHGGRLQQAQQLARRALLHRPLPRRLCPHEQLQAAAPRLDNERLLRLHQRQAVAHRGGRHAGQHVQARACRRVGGRQAAFQSLEVDLGAGNRTVKATNRVASRGSHPHRRS